MESPAGHSALPPRVHKVPWLTRPLSLLRSQSRAVVDGHLALCVVLYTIGSLLLGGSGTTTSECGSTESLRTQDVVRLVRVVIFGGSGCIAILIIDSVCSKPASSNSHGGIVCGEGLKMKDGEKGLNIPSFGWRHHNQAPDFRKNLSFHQQLHASGLRVKGHHLWAKRSTEG